MTDIEYELYHHGVKGMRWGRRRYQNTDGSLTPAGKKRYITVAQANRNAANAEKEARRASIQADRASGLTGIGSARKAILNANAAAKTARKESLKNDKAYNKQLRAERRDVPTNREVAKVALGSAAIGIGIVGATAAAISIIGSKTRSQVNSYANVGRTIVNTIPIDRIPVSTIPVNRVQW